MTQCQACPRRRRSSPSSLRSMAIEKAGHDRHERGRQPRLATDLVRARIAGTGKRFRRRVTRDNDDSHIFRRRIGLDAPRVSHPSNTGIARSMMTTSRFRSAIRSKRCAPSAASIGLKPRERTWRHRWRDCLRHRRPHRPDVAVLVASSADSTHAPASSSVCAQSFLITTRSRDAEPA